MKIDHQEHADEAGDDRRRAASRTAEGGRHGLDRLRLELDRQRAAVEHGGQVVGLALGEVAGDLRPVG